MYRRFGKRLLDLCIGIPLSIMFLPAGVICSFIVYFQLGRPIFFLQERIGLNDQVFSVIKFRTMSNSPSDNQLRDSDLSRTTKITNQMRSWSLDEIPQLLNVLRGEMSLVGPRPLLTSYLSLYSPEQRRRHDVKPGLTGLAQVNGRNRISWEFKFQLDLQYVERLTFLLDLRIMLRTITYVFKIDSVNSEPGESMPTFGGFIGDK
jgi:undecaprenyl phosphate N,N'-diacetylbacillosamine 1-phosphate transferase